jgi:hypothetical protein
MHDKELTIEQARRLRLPDRDPISGDWIVWAETPAEPFADVRAILGGRERAA